MLHIHNGDASANMAKQSSLAGEHLPWRESLITGSTPSGLSEDEWRNVRARHLSAAYVEDVQECERDLLRQAEALASFSEHDEVVLWFEHDLFCQLHLVYLLTWFSQRSLGNTKLSLICIGEFPGKENFRGLGELNPEQLASLFPTRQQVTTTQMSLAASAWCAYCSSDPTDIEKLLQTDSSALPFLEAALRAHLERFPSTRNGLGRIENRALEFIHDGLNSFSELFLRFGEAEPVYGFGDAQFWSALQRVTAANQPLLRIGGIESGSAQQPLTQDIARNAKFELTDLGESVRNGEADFVTLNGIDLWLGGAYLHDREGLWRWNEQSQAIEFSTS
jgi:hypothetical protein